MHKKHMTQTYPKLRKGNKICIFPIYLYFKNEFYRNFDFLQDNQIYCNKDSGPLLRGPLYVYVFITLFT
jgi:hypothetical protein